MIVSMFGNIWASIENFPFLQKTWTYIDILCSNSEEKNILLRFSFLIKSLDQYYNMEVDSLSNIRKKGLFHFDDKSLFFFANLANFKNVQVRFIF